MNKPTCNWCEVEISPVVLGLYPDGTEHVNAFCTTWCEMEKLTNGLFRKRSLLKDIFTKSMCDEFFKAKRLGYIPAKGSRAASIHIGVEPMALWDDNSSWNIFEQEFVPIT